MSRRVLVTGAGGFIGGHAVKRLVAEGRDVVAVDIKSQDAWYQVQCDALNFDLCDLRDPYATASLSGRGYDEIYNFAADMGGMGFIAAHRVDCMNSVSIIVNMTKLALETGAKLFFASSACVYPDYRQQTEQVSLKEEDAWPADPEPGYGLEKLFGEQLCQFYHEEHGLNTRVARFHNIFGPKGTWDGGREKAPAAICRKVARAALFGETDVEIWGDGEQTRSFLYVDECLEGVDRLMQSTTTEPLNVGSDELVSINQLVSMVEDIAGVRVKRHYDLSKPQGVRGRNSDNTKIRELLGWSPSSKLIDGLEVTYHWIYDEIKSGKKTK